MAPLPAPDPPPPPTGFLQETPLEQRVSAAANQRSMAAVAAQRCLESAITTANSIFNYLADSVSSKNPTHTLHFKQICTLITRVSSLKNLLGKISPVEESNPNKQILEKIADRLDHLERWTMTMISPQPPTWAAITNKETHRKKKTPQQPPIPTNTEINEFKKASVVIRTPPGFVALDSILAPKITSKINHALKSINATFNSQIIEIAGIAGLPLKDLKSFTATRPQAQWQLDNKHIWTELQTLQIYKNSAGKIGLTHL
ncbi:hypothetical protein PCANC_10137 [Puccinia coronata f. sp. avenae]|uniref:Uncharacterized protein n=1 Tax=Puccinia coronata f. sp. avenae TaxID=200324 RepID=A0A2N5V689_9BASI|nr:hypothetical protein PCANC_10137 [Puccinia coronata f. sp. avenae]